MQLRELVTRYIILRNSDIVRNLVQPFIKTFLQPTPEFTQLQSEGSREGKKEKKKKKRKLLPQHQAAVRKDLQLCADTK